MTIRVSESVKIGPFRIRLSAPVGRGRARIGIGTRIGRTWIGASEPLGGKKRKR